jgi:NAD(P)H-dependent FMN reductase
MNKGAGGVTGIYNTDPFFAFHHVNAFESSSKEITLPAKVKEFKSKIREADAILIATPEYNYSVPGVQTLALLHMLQTAWSIC